MATELKKRKITSEAFHLLIREGIFSVEDKIELLNGEIIEMSPVGNHHVGVAAWLTRNFNKYLPEDTLVLVQSPISLGPYSEPEPDLVVCRFRADYYRQHRVKPDDILLLIEVSDSSYTKDQEVKLSLYSEAGIPEYWIVNLQKSRIERYAEPVGNTYKSSRYFMKDDSIDVPRSNVSFEVKKLIGD